MDVYVIIHPHHQRIYMYVFKGVCVCAVFFFTNKHVCICSCRGWWLKNLKSRAKNLINGTPTRVSDPTIQTLKYVVNSHPFLFPKRGRQAGSQRGSSNSRSMYLLLVESSSSSSNSSQGSGTLMDDCANSASAASQFVCRRGPVALIHKT